MNNNKFKTLKFTKVLSELILKGEKTTTWRIFDDKNISTGDLFIFIVKELLQEFAKAKIKDVKETSFKNLSFKDWDGHEKFSSNEEMYNTYSKYYDTQITEYTIVKVIQFELI